jgi:hypothetical protein
MYTLSLYLHPPVPLRPIELDLIHLGLEQSGLLLLLYLLHHLYLILYLILYLTLYLLLHLHLIVYLRMVKGT